MGNTYWEYEDQLVTLDDIQRLISWHNIPSTSIKIKTLGHLLTVKTHKQRVERADLTHPILLISKMGKPALLLDGHHRVQQAIQSGNPQIDGYDIDVSLVPQVLRDAIHTSS